MSNNGWVGIDLDGTLAHYDHWRGPEHIGAPIAEMVAHVKKLLALGVRVKVFTARACIPEQVPPVVAWLEAQGLGRLEVTNVKDFHMKLLYDDRAIQVVSNLGIRADGLPL